MFLLKISSENVNTSVVTCQISSNLLKIPLEKLPFLWLL